MNSKSQYKFSIHERAISSLNNKDHKTFFEKWYLQDRIKVWSFTFDQQFHHYQKESFVQDFLSDNNVTSTIQTLSENGGWCNVGTDVKLIEVEEVPCTLTTMKIFDKLYEENIVRSSGSICRCFDEFYEGITISDELRKMLLLEDSDNYEMYSDEERREFLFKLFLHLCIGGPICQFEDEIKPYLDITKSLYKDLISVQKNTENNEMTVVSKVYKITGKDQNGTKIYPSTTDHIQNFAYLIVEPIRRNVNLLYHSWGKGFW